MVAILALAFTPWGFSLVAPMVAKATILSRGEPSAWTTWGWAYSGNSKAWASVNAAEAGEHWLRQPALLSRVENNAAPMDDRVLSLGILALAPRSGTALNRVLIDPRTPRRLRRSVLEERVVGRSPHPIVETARFVAIDGLFDLALVVSAAPLESEADLPDELPDELSSLAASLRGGDDGAVFAELVEKHQHARAFQRGTALSLGSAKGQSPDPPRLPAVLEELAPVEHISEHLAHEFSAIVEWIRAEPDATSARWLRASITTLPPTAAGPAPAAVHAVLRGESASPALAALTVAALANSAGLTATTLAEGEGFVVMAGNLALRITDCGARLAIPAPADRVPLTEAEVRTASRIEVASGILIDERQTLSERLLSLAEIGAPHESAPMLALSQSRDPNPNTAPIVAWWQWRLGHPDAAYENLQTPTIGPSESIRIAALSAMGEPVKPRPMPSSSCRSASIPWPSRNAQP